MHVLETTRKDTVTDIKGGTVVQPEPKRKLLKDRAVEYPEKPLTSATPAPKSMAKGVSLQSMVGVYCSLLHRHTNPLSATGPLMVGLIRGSGLLPNS